MADENYFIELKLLKRDFVKSRIMFKDSIQEITENVLNERDLEELAIFNRHKLNQLRNFVQELEKLLQDESDLERRKMIEKELTDWLTQIQYDHQLLRKSILASQLAITQRNKDELFSNKSLSEESTVRCRDLSKEMLLKNSSSLTSDLLTVTRMVQSNTEKSSKTLDKLVESSQMVTNTQEELKTMDSVIGQAKKVLSKFGRRENTDKLLIFLGFIFFLASCLVVIRNRFIFFF